MLRSGDAMLMLKAREGGDPRCKNEGGKRGWKDGRGELVGREFIGRDSFVDLR